MGEKFHSHWEENRKIGVSACNLQKNRGPFLGLVTKKGPLFRGGRSCRRFRAGSFDSVVKAFAGRSYSARKTWPASDKCPNLFRTIVLCQAKAIAFRNLRSLEFFRGRDETHKRPAPACLKPRVY